MQHKRFGLIGLCSTLVAFNLLGCSQGQSSDARPPAMPVATDSAGLQSRIQLRFATFGSNDNPLTDDGPFALSESLVLTDARMNIVRVKLHRERTPAALALKQEIKDKKDSLKARIRLWEAEIDAIKDAYEPRIKNASNKAEKESLKDARDRDIAKIEEQLAAESERVKQEIELLKRLIEDDDVQWTGTFIYDLLQSSSRPDLLPIKALDGTYEHIDFTIHPNRQLPASDPLAGRSLYFAGYAQLETGKTPFQISMDQTETLRLDLDDSFFVSSSATQTLTIGTLPQLWFKDWNLADAKVDEDGVIRIDATHNVRLFRQLMERMTSLSLSAIDDHGRHHGAGHT